MYKRDQIGKLSVNVQTFKDDIFSSATVKTRGKFEETKLVNFSARGSIIMELYMTQVHDAVKPLGICKLHDSSCNMQSISTIMSHSQLELSVVRPTAIETI